VELLGDYLPLLADAATHGRRAKRRELDAVGLLGRRAAEQGKSAGKVVQLYLSAARRLWQDCAQLEAALPSRRPDLGPKEGDLQVACVIIGVDPHKRSATNEVIGRGGPPPANRLPQILPARRPPTRQVGQRL
jgi:hypothetical protein